MDFLFWLQCAAAADRWNEVRADLEHRLGRPATLLEVQAAVDADVRERTRIGRAAAVFAAFVAAAALLSLLL